VLGTGWGARARRRLHRWAIGMNHPRATGPSFGDEEPYIYKKGPAFGMPGVLVDGMDVRKARPLRPLVQ